MGLGLPQWPSGIESACQCRRRKFDPWIGKILWSRRWQPTPVFLPEESCGWRRLAGYSPCGGKDSDTTVQLGPCTCTLWVWNWVITSESESGLGIRVKGQCVKVSQKEKNGAETEAGSSQHLEMTGGEEGGREDSWRGRTAAGSISQEESPSGRRPMGSTWVS